MGHILICRMVWILIKNYWYPGNYTKHSAVLCWWKLKGMEIKGWKLKLKREGAGSTDIVTNAFFHPIFSPFGMSTTLVNIIRFFWRQHQWFYIYIRVLLLLIALSLLIGIWRSNLALGWLKLFRVINVRFLVLVPLAGKIVRIFQSVAIFAVSSVVILQ